MVLARSGALSAVSVWLAARLKRQDHTVRPPWRAGCDEAPAQRGARRQALAGDDSVGPLLGWGLSGWPGTPRAVAREATTLGPRFTVVAIRVVYRGCALPVAWTSLPANQPTAWRRLAAPLAARRLAGWDGARVGRSRSVCPLAVSADGPLGRAPLPAPQPRGHLPAGATGRLPPVDQLRAAARHARAGDRHRLHKPAAPAAVDAVGLLGGGRHRSLADPDRAATHGQRGRLVWPAGLDRTGLQDDQARGLAVAAHAQDPARPGRPLGAGGRGRHAVAAARGRPWPRRRSRRGHGSMGRTRWPARAANAAPPAGAWSVSFGAAGSRSWSPCARRPRCLGALFAQRRGPECLRSRPVRV